ncbi:MAG: 23S rRNA (guanine2445-N2)-methyltransferase / 23S rRNA (guanine2069-N7)-methyltransferase, partial [Neolewinella sp.]
MSQKHPFIATCPKGLEQLLASEIAALGAEVGRETVGSISFVTDVATAYRVCLWS